jgi:putative hydrolase of the HAD superfamily
MKTSQIEAIAFDFGNVVGYFDHRLTTNRLAAYSDLSADALHAALFASPLEHDYDCGRLSTEDFLAQARRSCGLRCSEAAIAAAWTDIFWPNPDVCVLLPFLKRHYCLLLASNTNKMHSHQFRLQFATVMQCFDHTVLSHEIGMRKPDGAFFEYCRRLAACAPEKCVFIDDLPANVAGAQACNWQAIRYAGIADLTRRLVDLGIKELGP